MALTYNSTTIDLVDGEEWKCLGIYDFIEAFKYPIDKLYIDKFWDSLNSNTWIVVDYQMLKWIGYDAARDRAKKEKYKNLLIRNFKEGIDYDMISGGDPRIRHQVVALKDTIIVHPKTFKKSLMMSQTKPAEEIREYYLLIEEVLIDYLRYTQAVQVHNSSIIEFKLKKRVEVYKQKALEHTLEFDFNPKQMAMTEYVYILTSQRYYRQHMFKVGKTTNPKQRLIGYNIGAALGEDEMFYVCKIQTFDCGGLEKMLHRALENYRVRKEWFHIPQERMLEIVKLVNKQQTELCSVINEQLKTEMPDLPKGVEMSEFDENNHVEEVTTVVVPATQESNDDITTGKYKCDKCNKEYTSKTPYEKHIRTCTGNQCMNCKQKFASKRDLQSHQKRLVKCINPDTGERAETKLYTCEDCGLVLTTEKRFVNHREGGCKYAVPCPHCNSVFKAKHTLDKHLRDNVCRTECQPHKHSLKKDGFHWRCQGCRKKFLSKTNATKHVLTCDKEHC